MIENILSANYTQAIGSVKSAERLSDKETKEIEKISENLDEYVPSDEKEPIGLYSVSPDEDGKPQISFDKAGDAPEKKSVTGNTDNVDREIKILRNKAQTLRRKLRSADESAAADIRRELEQVTAELAQKDNDEYRRQHTVFT